MALALYHKRLNIFLLALLNFLVLPAISQSENLVVNPSFEQEVDFSGQPDTNNWAKVLTSDTPDYITFNDRGKPNFYYRKYIGGLLPYDGVAYVGIFCYRLHPLRGIENVREFVQAPLKNKLEKDTLYKVSLHIALDPESNMAINNINIHFAPGKVSKKREKEMYGQSPLVKFKRSYYNSDSWIKLETKYKAKGTESQIIIGNFLSDKSTGKKKVKFESDMQEKWKLHELERVAYYYIDMVNVEKYSTTSCPEKKPHSVPNSRPDHEEARFDTSVIEIDRVKPDSSVVLNQIFFDFDKSLLLPESYRELDNIFDQLQQFIDLSIIIEGHTDHLGTYEYNMQLSLKRAQAVAEYLLEKGLDSERISYIGLGYTHPLSDNRTEKGRQLNRRVAFRISGPAQKYNQ